MDASALNNPRLKALVEVTFRATYWCRFWAQLQLKMEDQELIKSSCRKMEMVLLKFFRNFGWGAAWRLTL
uniref:Uncharacterized protein n=1 Tax=Zea mays TaxID=4577 RepID=B6TT63_MAIZE|nr:hypothetical protein [Zea mays]